MAQKNQHSLPARLAILDARYARKIDFHHSAARRKVNSGKISEVFCFFVTLSRSRGESLNGCSSVWPSSNCVLQNFGNVKNQCIPKVFIIR
jgi:hypothetical protein